MGRVAVIDFGTNTTRLLVADVAGGRVSEVDHRSKVTRLGEGVDSSGRLGDEAIERVLAVVAQYREAIEALGSPRTIAVATSAVRDAANADDLLGPLRERFEVEARTISGGEEARLTFLGATAGRAGSEYGPVLVLDIGGGSTELVVGEPGAQPSFHVSTRAGSVRQTERHISGDPPPPGDLESLAGEVREILVSDVPKRVRGSIRRGIAVAGTATSLAAIDQELDPFDSDRVDSYQLELGACERMLELLAELPLEQRRGVTGLDPDRAPTIVAGTIILIEAMRACGLEALQTSVADILHGAALTAESANSGV